ncbi:MAG: restriction endonuclease [Burkholderiaceae bacterium]|nr:restriction endonuclease [Burkholderiaceae bacterium]
MAIPDYESLMLPLLSRISDGKIYLLKEIVAEFAEIFELTPEEKLQLLPSGESLTFASRVGWAKTYLKKAGLVQQPKRGFVQITELGQETLLQKPNQINKKFLEKFPTFLAFINTSKERSIASAPNTSTVPSLAVDLTPDEVMDAAYQKSVLALADEVLDRIKACSPVYFERLVVQLLIKMGYGGSREEAGRTVGRSGDGGIDGIINEDRLGLDSIYLQAKRWEGVVGRPEIMKFVGALAGQRATKGVFITTSWFTQEAKDYAASSQYKVVLIDGERLAYLMIEHDLGVSVAATYHLKRIDSDFFSEE